MTDEATENNAEQLGAEEAVEQPTKQEADKGTQTGEESGQEKQVEQDIKDAKEQGVSVEEFQKTQKALHKANKEAQQRREKLAEWNDINATPAEIKQMLQERKEAEIKKAEEEGRYQDLLDSMRSETEQEREKSRKEVEQRDQMIDRLTRKSEITSAVSTEGGIAEMLTDKLERETKTIYEDGEPKAVLVDASGEPRKDSNGEYLSVASRVQELKNDPVWSHAFPAPRKSGSGTNSQTGAKPAPKAPAPAKKKADMSLQERDAYRAQHGLEALKALK